MLARSLVAAALLAATLAAPAAAQSTVTLDASAGVSPLVEGQINGQPVRLEVELRMFDALALSNAAAERLRVRRLPLAALRVGVEGSDAAIRGRVARPRFHIAGQPARAFAGIFPAPVSARADGVIGPGALPQSIITVVLREEPEGARDIVFALADPDIWEAEAQVGGQTLRVFFTLAREASVFNRPAARLFDSDGQIEAHGDLVEAPIALGLNTLMQPVRTELRVQGLPLAPAFARTNAPLLGATEPDAFVVSAETEAPPPSVTLGRAAFSQCAWLRVDRRARTLTLRCAL
ncbi:MAG: hypothetical protein KF700_08320 [Hyphomonadaceae bacterium]|nr:hypothetical protein [Hyphomonadaceae bacterium]